MSADPIRQADEYRAEVWTNLREALAKARGGL